MRERLGPLADIIGPAPPTASPVPEHGLAITVVAVCVIGLIVLWVRMGSSRRARRRLRALGRDYRNGRLAGREMAYQVAGELASAFRVRRVKADEVPAGLQPADRARWVDLVTHLDALRYRPDAALDPEETARLVAWVQTRIGRRR
jgi:hypothetical protein